MPIYEYECTACGAHADKKHAYKEPMTDPCPACGGELKRVFNAASIVFKGSGFYVNDSKKGSSGSTNAASSAGGDAKSGDAKNGETKSGETKAAESKSDAKSGPSSDAAA